VRDADDGVVPGTRGIAHVHLRGMMEISGTGRTRRAATRP
jgi:hypothetical protein